ncbi:MAG: hypothetical protein GF398_14810 [Chitinivibrionales bacterium]|nr:hypothetical protein [Chitinivibrionales bacterium]
MAQSGKLKDKLRLLSQIISAPLTPTAESEIAKALESKQNLLVAKAAKAVQMHELTAHTPQLIAAFERFLIEGEKTDKLCHAKTAITTALDELNCVDCGIFLKGIHCRQYEPSWGGSTDTAGELRAISATALAGSGYAGIYYELTDLLYDSEPRARSGAARALAFMGTESSELILRARILAGELVEDVVGTCFSALMGINPHQSFDFVARYLEDKNPAIAEEAAFALGESRVAPALDALRNVYAHTFNTEWKRTLLIAVALIRTDEALGFLIDAVANEEVASAHHALEALSSYGHDEKLVERLQVVVAQRGDEAIRSRFYAVFARS